MRGPAIGLVMSLALAACGAGGSASSSSSSSTGTSVSPSGPSSSTTPTQLVLPSPSGQGFCADRSIIDDVVALVRSGVEPYRKVAAFVTAAGKVMRADATSAPTDVGAFKMRQLSLVLNTLRLAVLGAVENYPQDYAVRQFTKALPARMRELSRAVGCPP